MKTFVCHTTQSLKDFTDSVYPQGSFCFAALLRGGDIKVDGVRASKNVTVTAGSTVVYYTTARQESAPSHTVIYEDGNIIVADKFSGVSAEGLCVELSARGECYAVHRLDRNTAGVICFAKTSAAAEELKAAFAGRGVQKKYLAVCKDNFKSGGAVLTAYAVKNPKTAEVRVHAAPVKGAKTMVTEYSVLQKKDGLALVKITLHTGRTHQIRAHMAFIGCPVLGDMKYGDAALNKKYLAARQRLLSKSLCFTDLKDPLAYLNGRTFESGQTLYLDSAR